MPWLGSCIQILRLAVTLISAVSHGWIRGFFPHYPPTTPCNNLLIFFVLVFHSSGALFRHIKVSFSYPYFHLNQLANHVTQILDNTVPTSNRMVTTSNRYAPPLLLDTTSPAATWTPATATSSRSTTCQWWEGLGVVCQSTCLLSLNMTSLRLQELEKQLKQALDSEDMSNANPLGYLQRLGCRADLTGHRDKINAIGLHPLALYSVLASASEDASQKSRYYGIGIQESVSIFISKSTDINYINLIIELIYLELEHFFCKLVGHLRVRCPARWPRWSSFSSYLILLSDYLTCKYQLCLRNGRFLVEQPKSASRKGKF